MSRTRDDYVHLRECADHTIANQVNQGLRIEEAARQLYKEWFVRFRFPGHEHVPIVDGVPDGWELKPLGEIAVTNEASHNAKGRLIEVGDHFRRDGSH